MKATIQTEFGGWNLKYVEDFPKPQPKAGELLVKVVFAAVNPVDWKMSNNSWWGIGGLGAPVKASTPWIYGGDASGVVEAVGEGVTKFKPGDRVFYTHPIFEVGGTYAEYNTVAQSYVAHMPEGMSFEDGAALPLAGQTAIDLVNRTRVSYGETVVVTGGNGAVGSYAVQIARAAGARVLATCSEASSAKVKGLGAHFTIDYRSATPIDQQVLALTGGEGADVWIDTTTTVGGGATALATICNSLKHYGRISYCADLALPQGLSHGFAWKELEIHAVFVRYADWKVEKLANLYRDGFLKAVLDKTYSLREVLEAWNRSKSGQASGKILIKIE